MEEFTNGNKSIIEFDILSVIFFDNSKKKSFCRKCLRSKSGRSKSKRRRPDTKLDSFTIFNMSKTLLMLKRSRLVARLCDY